MLHWASENMLSIKVGNILAGNEVVSCETIPQVSAMKGMGGHHNYMCMCALLYANMYFSLYMSVYICTYV